MDWLRNWLGLGGGRTDSSVPLFTFTEAQIIAPVKHIMPTVPANTPQALREIKRAWSGVVNRLEHTPLIYSEPIPGVTTARDSIASLANCMLREDNGKIGTLQQIWNMTMQHLDGVEASAAAYEDIERLERRAMVYDLDAFRDTRKIIRIEAPKDATSPSFVLRSFMTEFTELDKAARAPANEHAEQPKCLPGRPHFLR